MNKLKKELKQLKIQIRVGIDQKQISQDWGILLLDNLEEAINYTHCCEEFADGKCRPMVNADWTYLRCECGKRFKPKG
jgi:hypothetical protein